MRLVVQSKHPPNNASNARAEGKPSFFVRKNTNKYLQCDFLQSGLPPNSMPTGHESVLYIYNVINQRLFFNELYFTFRNIFRSYIYIF